MESEKVFTFSIRLYILLFLFILKPFASYSQGELDTVPLVVHHNFRTVNFSLSTNGLALGYRYLRHKDVVSKLPFEFEFAIIHHPKEERISNRAYSVSRGYIYGKLNDFFDFRLGSGIERRLVEKSEPGSIGISFSALTGISLGLQKPIYYQIIYPTGPYSFDLHDELFNAERHTTDNIYSRSSFFKGLSSTKLVPGIYIKSGFCFDYGRKSSVMNRLELGAQLEFFVKKVELMALVGNQQLLFTFFASYRLGVGKPIR